MNSFFLLFIGVPALEVFLMIKIGGKIGALNTVSLIFLTAIIGLYFAKLEGMKTMKSGVMNLYQNYLMLIQSHLIFGNLIRFHIAQYLKLLMKNF